MTQCSKCGKTVSKNIKFCPDCGTKMQFEEPKKEISQNEPKKSYKWLWITLGVIVVLLIIFVPTKQVAYTVEVPYSEDVPYTDIETNTRNTCENIHSGYDIRIEDENIHLVDGQIGVTVYFRNYYTDGFVSVGFSVTCWGDDGRQYTITGYHSSEGFYDGSGFFGDTFPGINSLTRCSLYVSKAERCYDKTTTDSVIKTETVQKTRTETRYRTVNWLFG